MTGKTPSVRGVEFTNFGAKCLVGEKRKEEKKVQPLTSCGTINLSSVLDGCWIGVENVGLMLDL